MSTHYWLSNDASARSVAAAALISVRQLRDISRRMAAQHDWPSWKDMCDKSAKDYTQAARILRSDLLCRGVAGRRRK